MAHSNAGAGGHIYPNPDISSSSQCYEGSYFAAYKNKDGGLTTMYRTDEMRMSHMTFIDNEKGMSLNTAGDGPSKKVLLKDTIFYGETDNKDCPAG